MRPSVVVEGARVFLGDCRDVLKSLPDNSVDSIVTDPPYELGFMGKSWDNSGIAYDVTVWEECLRVLKPGGHILAFGGTRTWHRLAVAIEDAGFEIRDNIAWIYGSGFPKSLDVSKAIDKRGGNIAGQSDFARALREAKAKTNLTIADLNEVLGNKNSNLWSHFVGDIQPQVPTTENYFKLKDVLPIGDEWDSLFLSEAEREVIGQTTGVKSPGFAGDRYSVNGGEAVEVPTTLPATPQAQQWQGWGTALKPAFEPVVVGRKPLVGTVANNVLAWGVGGLNIDGSRVAGDMSEFVSATGKPRSGMGHAHGFAMGEGFGGENANPPHAQGRWPANVVLDEVTAGLLDEQSGQQKDGTATGRPNKGIGYGGGWGPMPDVRHGFGGQGGASRFFYQAKASKRDRNEGLEELEARIVNENTPPGTSGANSPRAGAGRNGAAKNFHPTVKPTQLMRYLIKLVTPPGGVVLDPFTGSGSTGKAALLDGYEFVGAELTEEYLPIIEGRLRWAVENRDEDGTLF